MRVKKWRGTVWAARLGLLALALYSLVPIHIAFDLAEVLGSPEQCGAHIELHRADWHLLALLSGHHDADGKSGEPTKHHECPVCSALGLLAGFAPPAPTALSPPDAAQLPTALSIVQDELVRAPAAYRSRAPPTA